MRPFFAMDGHARAPRLSARRRLAAAFAALAVVCAGAGTALAASGEQSPDQRWPAEGTAIATATRIAQEYWGVTTACGGDVTIAWLRLAPQTNASSSWAADGDGPYADPSRNESCEIDLSTRADWDWPKLCTVLVHEYGHLTGHGHVADPGDIMYPYYVRPIEQCVDTPEPEEPQAPATTTATLVATPLPAPPKAKAKHKPKASGKAAARRKQRAKRR